MKFNQVIEKAQIKFQKKFLNRNDNLFAVLSLLDGYRQIIQSDKSVRERIYTPLQTILCFVQQVLDTDKSCSKAVAKLAAARCLSGANAISILTGAYVKARQRLAEGIIPQLVHAVGNETAKKASISWKAFHREVKVCDGTTVNMPDTKANRQAYPPHSNGKKATGLPLARIVAVMSLTTGSIIDYAIDAFKGKGTGEVSLLRRTLGCINEHDIVLGDALYCNFF